MIDMHLHTYYSDGTLSPTELVRRAAARGVKTIALTDHDGFNGVAEALKAGEEYGVEVIPGVELSAVMPGEDLGPASSGWAGEIINMHILGYEIDICNKELRRAVMEIRRKREERNLKLLSALNGIGYKIRKEDLLQRKGQDYVGKPNFALALIKRGYVKSAREANTPGLFLRHPEARKIHREKIHVRDAISLIKQADGYAVLAHPMKVKFPGGEESKRFSQLELLLDKLQEWGLSGMECYYSTHTVKQAARLADVAARRKLIITSGSDFHGPELDPDLDIGITGKEK
ncbi:MAG TPA: PHP domain-containing protein [Bacillota bacterium]|jgi:hypothetical protein|nr:PHP domain-containing protein [Bacillota bacterium]